MGRQTIKWSSKMPIFVSFARYIFQIFIPRHDKLTQCCRAFTLALARFSCTTEPQKIEPVEFVPKQRAVDCRIVEPKGNELPVASACCYRLGWRLTRAGLACGCDKDGVVDFDRRLLVATVRRHPVRPFVRLSVTLSVLSISVNSSSISR